ncbi:FkbM family methyltransferase [Candidatus Binatus sp.]|uniref:FkbM family methyltransferase n=2 Tax=Candidatus Binatus sp. TaxID=2811406 RepID=UPI003CC60BA7
MSRELEASQPEAAGRKALLVLKSRLKSAIKASPYYEFLNGLRRRTRQFFFERQGTITVKIGNFDILMPSAHPLPNFFASQPYRDLCIGIAAKYLGRKYPHAAILDIGANVGDSAAHIATYCDNDLILVEPSTFFGRYLEMNVRKLPNKCTVEPVLISPEERPNGSHGRMVHWAGTAHFESAASCPELKTKTLSSFDRPICMVKIDTDGNDFAIINNSIDWFEKRQPGLLFEHEIRSRSDLDRADATFENLLRSGYRYFVVFDDPGFMILSTGNVGILKDLNRYQYRIWASAGANKTICNFDVLALQDKDRDVFEDVLNYFNSQT